MFLHHSHTAMKHYGAALLRQGFRADDTTPYRWDGHVGDRDVHVLGVPAQRYSDGRWTNYYLMLVVTIVDREVDFECEAASTVRFAPTPYGLIVTSPEPGVRERFFEIPHAAPLACQLLTPAARKESRKLAAGNDACFLHLTNPALPPGRIVPLLEQLVWLAPHVESLPPISAATKARLKAEADASWRSAKRFFAVALAGIVLLFAFSVVFVIAVAVVEVYR